MAIRRRRGEESPEERTLEVNATMTGTLAFKDPVNLAINGRFEGTLDTKGSLTIGDQAQIKATITGERIVVGGNVQGQLAATSLLEIRATGRVQGKMSTPRLVVHDGAIVDGTIEMTGQRNANPWMTVEELSRYLEVDIATVNQWVKEGRLPSQRDGDAVRFERTKIEAWLAQEKVK